MTLHVDRGDNLASFKPVLNQFYGSLRCLTSANSFSSSIVKSFKRKQEAQLSQRERATLRVMEYFAKSLNVTQGHSKRHC